MKFKNMKDYLNQRNELMKQAQESVDNGEVEAANELMNKVQQLDEAFEGWKTANANMEALKKDARVTDAIPKPNETLITDAMTDGSKETGIDSKEYRDAWIKSMKSEKLTEAEMKIIDSVNSGIKINTETAGTHTLVVPTTVKNGIWEKAAELHPVLGDMQPTFLQGDITIIKDDSKDSDADWVDETDNSKDANFSEGSVELKGCELCKSVTISWKLKKMNNQDYETYLIRKLGEKIGNAIAKAAFHGKGKPGEGEAFKSQARGVITAIEAEEEKPQKVEFTTSITYKNMTELFARVKTTYKSGAAIYANGKTIWNELANILDGNKRPIFIPDVTAGCVGRIFGVPVKEEDGTDEGEVVLGNYAAGYAFNFNEDMAVYQEDHVKARTTDYMAYGIADGDVITTEAFALLARKEEQAAG